MTIKKPSSPTGRSGERSRLADPSRRDFFRRSAVMGVGAVAAGSTLLAGVNQGAKADGEPIPIGPCIKVEIPNTVQEPPRAYQPDCHIRRHGTLSLQNLGLEDG